jgi:hypothetical protein
MAAEQTADLVATTRKFTTSERLHRRVAADRRSAGMIAEARLMQANRDNRFNLVALA